MSTYDNRDALWILWQERDGINRAAAAAVRLNTLAAWSASFTARDRHDLAYALWDDYVRDHRAVERDRSEDEAIRQRWVFSIVRPLMAECDPSIMDADAFERHS
jgi:hypothetical protein